MYSARPGLGIRLPPGNPLGSPEGGRAGGAPGPSPPRRAGLVPSPRSRAALGGRQGSLRGRSGTGPAGLARGSLQGAGSCSRKLRSGHVAGRRAAAEGLRVPPSPGRAPRALSGGPRVPPRGALRAPLALPRPGRTGLRPCHEPLRPAGALPARLPGLPAAGRPARLLHRAPVREPPAGRAARPQGRLPGGQPLPERERAGALPGAGAERQPLRGVGAAERLGRRLQLGLRLRLLLLQHPGHHRGLRLHHAALGLRQGLLHLLRPAGCALHHAGADGHGAAPGPAPHPPAPRVPAAALCLQPPGAGPGPLPAAAAGRAGRLLPAAGRRLQRPGGDLELPGCLLLLLHLAVHHRAGRLRAGRAAGPEAAGAVQGLGHRVPAAGPDGRAAGPTDLPQGGRPARPHRPPAAAGRAPPRPGAHPGGRGDAGGAGARREAATCQQPAQHGQLGQLLLHQQIAAALPWGAALAGAGSGLPRWLRSRGSSLRDRACVCGRLWLWLWLWLGPGPVCMLGGRSRGVLISTSLFSPCCIPGQGAGTCPVSQPQPRQPCRAGAPGAGPSPPAPWALADGGSGKATLCVTGEREPGPGPG
ncbi:hypothetical protein KIL84_002186 [Mauremys mutica]|uniref:Uncharacterized protein n=1 Tax=Mauremys mutica TaxID=74926 RepID=A0A9D3XJS7_9SAUR|nr:hypothetical protein KIL84_002186 [Mauremys mutica]